LCVSTRTTSRFIPQLSESLSVFSALLNLFAWLPRFVVDFWLLKRQRPRQLAALRGVGEWSDSVNNARTILRFFIGINSVHYFTSGEWTKKQHADRKWVKAAQQCAFLGFNVAESISYMKASSPTLLPAVDGDKWGSRAVKCWLLTIYLEYYNIYLDWCKHQRRTRQLRALESGAGDDGSEYAATSSTTSSTTSSSSAGAALAARLLALHERKELGTFFVFFCARQSAFVTPFRFAHRAHAPPYLIRSTRLTWFAHTRQRTHILLSSVFAPLTSHNETKYKHRSVPCGCQHAGFGLRRRVARRRLFAAPVCRRQWSGNRQRNHGTLPLLLHEFIRLVS
jgi:hypothetical protein